MLRKIVLAAMLVGLVLSFSVSCSGQTVYVYEPIVDLYWSGANVDGGEVPLDLTATYYALQRPKGETSWANADTVMSNVPHVAMDVEHSRNAVIVGAQPGTYEHAIIFEAKDSDGQVVLLASCETNDIIYILGESVIPGCGARKR